MAIGNFTLTGQFFGLDGATPATGRVTIDGNPQVVVDSAGDKHRVGPRTVTLDTQGKFSTLLPTDTTTGNSTAIAFRVTVNLKHQNLAPVNLYARQANATVDLADIVSQAIPELTVLPAGPKGDPGAKGDPGPKGDPGLPGPTSVPADTAVAGYVAGPSLTASALSSTIAGQAERSRAYRTVKGIARPGFGKVSTATPQQIRVLALGDSVADFMWHFLYDPLNRAYGGGLVGASIGAGKSGTGWGISGITNNVTTGTIADASTDNNFDVWFSGYASRFSTGATRTYGMGGVAATWDTCRVYYAKGPSGFDGGTFKIQVDGVDEGAVIDTNGALGGGVVTITRGTVAQRVLNIVNLTGAHRIIGVEFQNSSQGGVVYAGISKGGISLADAVASPAARANLALFLDTFQPDLITLECKENSSYYATALSTLLDIIGAHAPQASFIGIGTTPVLTNDADQVIQNGQLRAACESRGHVYYDTYGMFGSYTAMHAFDSSDDGTHVGDKVNILRSAMMLNDLALLDMPGLNGTRPLDTPTARVRTRLDFGPPSQSADGVMTNARVQPSGSVDLDLILGRTMNITKVGNVPDTNSWTVRPDNTGDQQIPYGVRVGSAGPYLRGEGTYMQVATARGGGTRLDFAVRGIIKTTSAVSITGAATLDCSTSAVFLATLTGNVTSLAITNAQAGQDVEVHFIQDATGSRTITGFANAIHLAGGALTLTTTAGKRDILTFRFTGGVFYETGRSLNIA